MLREIIPAPAPAPHRRQRNQHSHRCTYVLYCVGCYYTAGALCCSLLPARCSLLAARCSLLPAPCSLLLPLVVIVVMWLRVWLCQELVLLGQKAGKTMEARKRKMMLEHLHQNVMKERGSIRMQLMELEKH